MTALPPVAPLRSSAIHNSSELRSKSHLVRRKDFRFPASTAFAIPLVLAGFLLLAACGKNAPTGLTPNRELQKWIASDTTTLAGIDVAAVRQTPFYARHESQLLTSGLDTVSGQVGFHLSRDLNALQLASDGIALVLACAGQFPRTQVEALLGSRVPQVSYRGQTLYQFRAPAMLGFAGPSLLLGSNLHALEGALDIGEKGAGKVPEELAAALASLSRDDQLWLVSRGRLPFSDLPLRSEYASLLSNFAGYVRSTALGITVQSGLHCHARVDCVSPQGSKRIYDALRGGIGLAHLTVKKNDTASLRLYDAIHVTKQGPTVFVTADFSPEQADLLLSRAVKVAISRLH